MTKSERDRLRALHELASAPGPITRDKINAKCMLDLEFEDRVVDMLDQLTAAEQEIARLRAKLARHEEALRFYEDARNCPLHVEHDEGKRARTALGEGGT